MKQTRRYRWFVVVALLCAVLALSSCAFLGKRSSLRTARDTYNTTLGALTELRAEGLFSTEAIERIETARAAAWAALDEWQECLETDQSVARAIADWADAMAVMIDARLATEGGQ